MGLLSKGFVFLAAAAMGAALATRPDVNQVHALYADRLIAQLEDGAIPYTDLVAAASLLVACTISPEQCAREIERTVSLRYTNRYLWASVRLQAPGIEAVNCTAALNRLFC